MGEQLSKRWAKTEQVLDRNLWQLAGQNGEWHPDFWQRKPARRRAGLKQEGAAFLPMLVQNPGHWAGAETSFSWLGDSFYGSQEQWEHAALLPGMIPGSSAP